ncbi:MAG: hypothetical protein J6B77_02385 [Clostridia bacterium]|nr:hypothetical protein [Clostridia bacterium]
MKLKLGTKTLALFLATVLLVSAMPTGVLAIDLESVSERERSEGLLHAFR